MCLVYSIILMGTLTILYSSLSILSGNKTCGRVFAKGFNFCDFVCFAAHQAPSEKEVNSQSFPLEWTHFQIGDKTTVNSRYLEIKGTFWNISKYPYFDI